METARLVFTRSTVRVICYDEKKQKKTSTSGAAGALQPRAAVMRKPTVGRTENLRSCWEQSQLEAHQGLITALMIDQLNSGSPPDVFCASIPLCFHSTHMNTLKKKWTSPEFAPRSRHAERQLPGWDSDAVKTDSSFFFFSLKFRIWFGKFLLPDFWPPARI